MITSLRNKLYEKRLASLNLFSLDKRRDRGKLVECFKILQGSSNVNAHKLLSTDNSSKSSRKGVKLRCKQVQLDRTKFFFTSDVVREWNNRPLFSVQCDTLISVRTNLTSTSSSKVCD